MQHMASMLKISTTKRSEKWIFQNKFQIVPAISLLFWTCFTCRLRFDRFIYLKSLYKGKEGSEIFHFIFKYIKIILKAPLNNSSS